jgi:hypothetical protein
MEEKTIVFEDFGKELNSIIYKTKEEEERLKKFLDCTENELKDLTEVMQFLIRKYKEKYNHISNNKILMQTVKSQMVKDALILNDTKDSLLELLNNNTVSDINSHKDSK